MTMTTEEKQLEVMLRDTLERIKTSSLPDEGKKEYQCKKCKDEEWIYNEDTNTAWPCTCREAKKYQRILSKSGISDIFLQKTFKNFEVKTQRTKKARDTAIKYVQEFNQIKGTQNNSIAFLGQVGSGKTHLSIAIANELMNRGIGVKYMQYRDDIMKIKQTAGDDLNYAREINQYKNASVLMIDDLFKGAVNNNAVNSADIRAMFEIINYRYLKGAPMIISSEYYTDQLLEFDEGVGSRIIHMCKGHIVELEGADLNYRLN